MTRLTAMIAVVALTAGAAAADEIVLDRAVLPGSLFEAGVEMTAYFEGGRGPVNLMLTFTESEAPMEPLQIFTTVAYGPGKTISLPGITDLEYTFTRVEGGVSVVAAAPKEIDLPDLPDAPVVTAAIQRPIAGDVCVVQGHHNEACALGRSQFTMAAYDTRTVSMLAAHGH